MSLKPLALAALLIASFLMAGCAGGGTGGGAAGQAIDIKSDLSFSPASVTVKVGTKVTWTNKDSTIHTVTSDDADGPLNSGNLAAGGKYSYTFTTAGTFKYHCTPHATKGADGTYTGMVATVTVTA
ncbi:MAG: cupredoxin domain-containing protein [Euryarchaeota archaeon]|nr:cupredoxin domain-containing protein [Euryarchaeota archaeon]